MPAFHLVVAVDLDGGIGKNGSLPWQLPGDMAFFKRLTTEVQESGKLNAVIMGRKTWQSIPAKFRPLKNRLNVVLSQDPSLALPEGVLRAENIDGALALCQKADVESVFVIGGGAVYATALSHPECDTVYLTEVRGRFACDTFFPALDAEFSECKDARSELKVDNGIEYVFKVYKRKSKYSGCTGLSGTVRAK